METVLVTIAVTVAAVVTEAATSVMAVTEEVEEAMVAATGWVGHLNSTAIRPPVYNIVGSTNISAKNGFVCK